MPIVTATQWVLSLLNGMPLPGNTGPLEAFITPPSVEDNQEDPHAYIWPSTGSENRESIPRAGVPGVGTNQSGWKTMSHQVDVFLVWFGDESDQTPDLTFLTVLDAVMDALRTCTDPVTQADPVTGRTSQVYATGERMTYDVAPVRGTSADQRVFRWDARIMARVLEDYQS